MMAYSDVEHQSRARNPQSTTSSTRKVRVRKWLFGRVDRPGTESAAHDADCIANSRPTCPFGPAVITRGGISVHEPLTSRPLAAHRTQLDALRNALAEGERSGTPTPFDFDAFLVRMRTTNH